MDNRGEKTEWRYPGPTRGQQFLVANCSKHFLALVSLHSLNNLNGRPRVVTTVLY